MKAWFADLMVTLLCPLIGHPPVTSIAFDGRAEDSMERTANVLALKGNTVKVSCACGRRMVDPIWRPHWRKDR